MSPTSRLVLAVVVGLAAGLVIAFLLRPVVLGALGGVILMIRVGDITAWRKGALLGAIVGFVIGVLTISQVVVSGVTPTHMLITGVTGAIVGALAGGITSHIRTRGTIWFP
jgi:hypothetical protein